MALPAPIKTIFWRAGGAAGDLFVPALTEAGPKDAAAEAANSLKRDLRFIAFQ
jgi:hypothetical protein